MPDVDTKIAHEERFKRIDKRLDIIEKKVDKLSSDTSSIDKLVAIIEEQNKQDKESINCSKKEIRELKTISIDNKHRLDQTDKIVANHDKRLANIEGRPSIFIENVKTAAITAIITGLISILIATTYGLGG